MEKIASFKVNHLVLLPGLYISRKDKINTLNGVSNDTTFVTTFDMRITRPNEEKVMDTGSIHTFEHLGATFLRNNQQWKDRIIYFGPMGCRTGFYLIISGDLEPYDILDLIEKMIKFVINFEGEIPGATPKDCGNYSDMNLSGAKLYALKYYKEVLEFKEERRFKYE